MALERRLYPNGVNGATGEYSAEPLDSATVLARIGGDHTHLLALHAKLDRAQKSNAALGANLDPRDLSLTGWGVLFPQSEHSESTYDALRPLLELRARQTREKPRGKQNYYREYRGKDGPGRDESKYDFLARHGVNSGMPADPEYMPYYLLIVGSPEEITFRFQYELDVEFAVGRVWFDSVAEYASYAAAVVASEERRLTAPKRVLVFGVECPNDIPTQLSAQYLVPPLAAELRDKSNGWDVQDIVGTEATKRRLLTELADAPGLVFTSSHGLYLPPGDENHERHQGALLCADWPGPGHGKVSSNQYVSADDAVGLRVSGSVFLHFACFGAGTPTENDFPDYPSPNPKRPIATRPFVAAWPRALLANGALAVVGHVERSWAYSFLSDTGQPQVQVFRDTLTLMLDGLPVGAAMEAFNLRYAALATALTSRTEALARQQSPKLSDLETAAALWADHNDARGFILLGDPAVRLKTGPRTDDRLPLQESDPMSNPIPVNVIEATARRVQQVFGTPPLRSEAFTDKTAGNPTQQREALRRIIEKVTPSERLRSNPPEAIAKRLRRLGLGTDVAEKASRDRSFVPGIESTQRPGLERIIGRNELLGVRYLDGGQAAARCVCRVVIKSATGATLGYGTGSLISPQLVMTNNHVLDSKNTARPSIIEFNYQLGLDNQFATIVTFALDPDVFFLTSPEDELDFTIVAVKQTSEDGTPLANFGHNPLRAVEAEVLNGESVTVIQHPGGEPKQIALRENRVLKLPNVGDQFLYYETDTTPGSSGAPVFNDQWEVVALHHSGFPAMNAAGQYLTADGTVWTQAMGEHRIHWIANEGIRVAAILQTLKEMQGLSTDQKKIRDGVLIAEAAVLPLTPDDRRDGGVSPPLSVTQLPASTGLPGLTASGTISLTGPLSLTIHIGSATAPSIQRPVPSMLAQTTPSVSTAATDPADDLAAAKAEFREAAARPYYDKPKDVADRSSYYAGLSDGLSPTKLYDALHQLLKSTHNTKPAYKPMREVYPWVDLQPNKRIKSVYSGKEFDPITLIEADFAVEVARAERIARFRRSEAAGDPAREAAMLESLEAALPFNCEHVVPQSWFTKKEPMRGDIHHLFACETGCNSFRSNIPYFDFADFGEAIRSDCGKREGNKFEPGAGKGAVARATLYFLLRYPGEINSNGSEYTPDRIEMLVGWHNEFLPEEYEKHRNQAIFARQGNRNPLIDFPEIAAKINFARGLG